MSLLNQEVRLTLPTHFEMEFTFVLCCDIIVIYINHLLIQISDIHFDM